MRLMREIDSTLSWCNNNTVPDPDLEIRDKGGGGGGGDQETRPWKNGGPGHQKNFFGPGLKIRGEGGQAPQAPPLNLPRQQQVYSVLTFLYMVLPIEIQ